MDADEGIILDDVEVIVVKIFAYWLCTQDLPKDERGTVDLAALIIDEDYSDSDGDILLLLLKACAFGDRFLARGFHIQAHNAYIDSAGPDRSIYYKRICLAFASFGNDNPMLNFMVDRQCSHWKGDDETPEEKQLYAELPSAFLVRVVCRFRELMQKPSSENVDVELIDYYLDAEEEKTKDNNDF